MAVGLTSGGQGAALSVFPTGLVTFLFTDIEGSTAIARRLGSGYDAVVENHNEIIRSSIDSFGGVEVSTEGDSFFAVFTTPAKAVGAALDAQGKVRAHQWPPGGSVSVRMGIHTGEGRLGGENYIGLDVIKAARISAAAHGGQVVLSDGSRSLLEPSTEYELRDLGGHRLKGLEGTDRLFQVVTDYLPTEFPPLRTVGPPTNLPGQASIFVGREKEADEVGDLLEAHRLVTLAGAGGVGKTRLAIHVANRLLGHFEAGIYLVRLEGIDDPGRVVPLISSTLGASQVDDQVESVSRHLGSRAALVVLDSFERVIPAGIELAHILDACPGLRLLVTSQRLLRIAMEQVYPVPPLQPPEGPDADDVRASDGGMLFVRRAISADPSFRLGEDNAAAIADIVAKLDGLPLAIELAAARVRLFGVHRLRNDVANHMSVLSGGFTDAPERHQSLEQAISWSYELLDTDAQTLLNRLSVFAGGFTLEAAEDICGGPPLATVAGTLSQLLDGSLITSTTFAGSVRFRMLQPLRSYGLTRLASMGERDSVSLTHCRYFTRLATDTAELLHGPTHYEAIARLAEERANITAALDWSAANRPDLGLSVLADLVYVFPVVGALAEAREIARNLLAVGGSAGPRLTGLLGAGAISYWLNDYPAARALYEKAITSATELGDADRLAEALYGQAFTLVWLGHLDEAEEMAERTMAASQTTGSDRRVRGVVTLRAFVAWMRGDLSEAARRLAEVIDLAHQAGDEGEALFNLLAFTGILTRLERLEEAAAAELWIMSRFVELADEGGTIHALDWLARPATAINPTRGLVIASATDRLRNQRGGFINLDRLGVSQPKMVAIDRLGADLANELWREGQRLDLEHTVSLAREWGEAEGISGAPIDPRAILATI